ncbi:hypothetical protein [Sanguibacter antarcticus]|uniref:Uncharacterized protein n=1 Tax=Sanguibacter antarcticus TaxID=372484 RepID=A0A2A9E842_9MICO|nr:hypothetical protein [Sanguibacter antarcticus]PFG34399.1 hypothetical protein ATL42_2309 [Sanguibacter antarcticus]
MTSPVLPAVFLAKVVQTAGDRAASWDAVADVLSPPDAALVERLRSGALTEVWRQGSSWLGDDVHVLTADLMSLDVYSRAASRRDPADDLADLLADHESLVARDAGVVAPVRDLAALCREEAIAWAQGDPVHAKSLRVAQHDLVSSRLVPALPELGGRLVRDARANVWRVLGRLVLAILSADTGKDFRRAVLGAAADRAGRRPDSTTD